MKSPFTEKEMTLVKEWREMTYRKETFHVYFHFYKCEETGEQFEDEQFSVLNYNQVINQYRVKHHIPFPEEIKEIRGKYSMSAAKMSEILGMGANSWRNYESGEIPSKVHANLIQMIKDSETFKNHVTLYSELEEKEKNKILKHIDKMESIEHSCEDLLIRFQSQPDIYSGFKAFDREKTKQTILFFALNQTPYKTKMNKLLFYSDFLNFKNNAQSITGLKYKAIPFGPVPNNFEMLFEILTEEKVIEKDWSMTEYGLVERILPTNEFKFDESVFTITEKETLDYVMKIFKNTGAKEIADISHSERAWIDNIEGNKLIPYHYAFDLEK